MFRDVVGIITYFSRYTHNFRVRCPLVHDEGIREGNWSNRPELGKGLIPICLWSMIRCFMSIAYSRKDLYS